MAMMDPIAKVKRSGKSHTPGHMICPAATVLSAGLAPGIHVCMGVGNTLGVLASRLFDLYLNLAGSITSLHSIQSQVAYQHGLTCHCLFALLMAMQPAVTVQSRQ